MIHSLDAFRWAERSRIQTLRGCLYGRRGGTFAGTGRFSSRVYMRMFLPGTISPGDNLQSQRSVYMIKIVPLCRHGTKNVTAKFFPYTWEWEQIRDIYTHGEIPFNLCRLTSRPASHINNPLVFSKLLKCTYNLMEHAKP